MENFYMNFILLLTSTFYLANSSYAQFTSSDSQYIQAENILVNGGFENGKAKWVNVSSGTFTIDSNVKIKGSSSAKLVLTAQTASLTQSSTLYASAFADGVQGVVKARVKSNVAVKVCAIQASVVSSTDCVDVVADNKWANYQIPVILGATSNGISIASSGAITGTVYVDDAYVGVADPFVSAPLITEWVDFPSVAAGVLITGTTTNPSYGTVATNKAQWRRVGSNMEIRWDYRQTATTGAASGSGNYLFNLPPGYEIDTTKFKANTSLGDTASAGNDSSSIGTIWGAYSTTGIYRGAMSVYSSTKLKGFIAFGATAIDTTYWGAVSPTSFLSFAGLSVNMSVSVPILGWSSSINTVTQQCQNDVECANEFSAKISSTGVVSGENVDWLSGNCTNVSAMVCTINTGVFSNTPNCEVTVNDTTSGREAHINSQTSTSFTVSRQESGSTLTKTDFGVSVLCQKSGTDYKARRAIVGSFKNVPVLSDFDGTKTANGYQKFPAGLIIQWGKYTTSQALGTAVPVLDTDFPIAFPNACLSIVGTKYNTGPVIDNDITMVCSTTQLGTRFRNQTSVPLTWMAIGY